MNIVVLKTSPGQNPETVIATILGGTNDNVGSPSNATVTIARLASQILSFTFSSTNRLMLQSSSLPGFIHQIVAKNHLTDADRMGLSGDVLAVSTMSSWTGNSNAGVPHRIYAVRGDIVSGVRSPRSRRI